MERFCGGCLSPQEEFCSAAPLPPKMAKFYYSFTERTTSDSDVSVWLCWKCTYLLKKCIAFKRNCTQSATIMENYLSRRKSDVQVASHYIKLEEEKISKSSLTFSKMQILEFPTSNVDDSKNSLFVKEEIKGDFQTLTENDPNHTIVGSEIEDVKNEFNDNSFCDSDDEPIICMAKRKKKKVKLKKSEKSQVSEINFKSKKTVLNTPSRNFDFSLVIVTSLSEEQQIKELESFRKSDEYLKSPYKCDMCARGFAHEIVYKEHIEKHDPVSGQYICHLCTQRFNTNRNLSNHLDTHSHRYTCRLCGKVVISKQNIMSHMYTEHDQTNKQIKCDLCQKLYKNRYTYTKHMRIHNGSKEYKCHLCHKVFLWRANLNRHLTRHKNEKLFTCDLCPKSFYLKENLKDHQLVHTNAKRFYCVECDLSYATQVKLNQHLKRGTRHLQPNQLTFACKLCDKKYANSLQLSMHVDRIHLNKRSQACQFCDAAFVGKNTLQKHIKAVHEGYRKPRDHICETCGKGFSDKRVLKAHLRTHTGEKPYSCKYCGTKFAHSGAMYTHVKLVHLKLKRNSLNRRKLGDVVNKLSVENPSIDSSVRPNISSLNSVKDFPK